SAPVVPLTNLPAVLTGVGQQQSGWLGPSVAWYDDPSRWNVDLAPGGPATCPRVSASETPPTIPVARTRVSDVRETTDSISFRVDRTGSPVLVKTSYFPNWVASGAQGPWRVTPNLMVVVPTSHTVTLSYGQGGPGKVGDVVTGIGLLGLVGGVVVERRRRSRRHGALGRTGVPSAIRASGGGVRRARRSVRAMIDEGRR